MTTKPIHFTTPEEAVKVIKSGDHVHLSSVASAPQCLINAMCKRGEAGELKDVHVHHLHRGSGALCRSQIRGRVPTRLVLRGRQRPQGDAERPCRLHSDLPERNAEAVPLRRRSVQRGDDSGLPARQAWLRVAGYVGGRYAGRRGVRRPRDRRGEQVRSPRLRSGDDPDVEDRHLRAGRHPADRSQVLGAERGRNGHRTELRGADRRRRDVADGYRSHSERRAQPAGEATRIWVSTPKCSPTACCRWWRRASSTAKPRKPTRARWFRPS